MTAAEAQGTEITIGSPNFLELLEKANRGDAKAELLAGLDYEEGRDVSQDYLEAMHWLRKAAADGSSAADYFIAGLYVCGSGVPKDGDEGGRWFMKSAQGGFAPAQYMIGSFYVEGVGFPRDVGLARHWMTLAAAQGKHERPAPGRT